jgi:mannose/fructose-specific phosphotransferase system component IIA
MLTPFVAMLSLAGASRMQRVVTGLALLLLVDVMWVATPEVTKVICL